MSDIMSYLFETKAVKFCEESKPFWYTSGKIGPYFINTHFLYGNEQMATEFLSFIDDCLSDKNSLPKKVFEKTLKQYMENTIYHNVIDTMISYIKENVDISEIDYISGGERRDWYFSNIIANLLEKEHITIYKDLSCMVSDSNFESTTIITDLTDKKVLHIADLVTVASSYIRAWLPAIKDLGGKIAWTCYVVDRKQGGTEKIEAEGVKTIPLVSIDNSLFEKAFEMNIINQAQFDMLKGFYNNPDETMRNFLIAHPEFLESALNSDEKTAKRAKLCIDSNLYNL